MGLDPVMYCSFVLIVCRTAVSVRVGFEESNLTIRGSTEVVFPAKGFPAHKDALGLHSPRYDIAYVQFINEVGSTVAVWMQTDICIGCKLLRVANLTRKQSKNSVAIVDTAWATRIKVTTLDAKSPHFNNTFCQLHYHFGLEGHYNLTVPNAFLNAPNTTDCGLKVVKKPVYANTAILVAYGIIFFSFFCAAIWVHGLKTCCSKNMSINHNGNTLPLPTGHITEDQLPLTVTTNCQKPYNVSSRLRSVDAFRGLAITHLVFGTSGDGHYSFMSHARWYGITVADFMFPWFVFIMGTSIHLSFNILISKGQSLSAIAKKLVIRSACLFVLGVCIQSHNDIRTLRIPGVLQRFGITYIVVASSYVFSRWIQMRRKAAKTGRCFLVFRNIVDYVELPIAFLCLVIHLSLTFLLPVPGCPLGYQGPGGPLVGQNGELTNCTGGTSGYIDRMFFTEAHMILKPTYQVTYHTTVSSDPEGILGTFTSIALCIFGLQAGKILHLFKSTSGRVTRLVLWGLPLIGCSAVLSKCSMADGWIPLNKNLWSVSFICLTGGTAFLIEALFHVLIDVTNFWNGAPIFYAGMNSILLYIGSEIMSRYLPFTWQPFVGNHTECVIMAVWSGLLWLFIAYVLYRKRIFLKL